MYKKIEGGTRMTRNEACLKYPDNYILVQRTSENLSDMDGIVLYVGDDFNELFSLQVDLPVPLGVVVEGVGIQRRYSMGGIVVGE